MVATVLKKMVLLIKINMAGLLLLVYLCPMAARTPYVLKILLKMQRFCHAWVLNVIF
ncbi:hypothetical protein Y788_19860 [Pantoea dispersa 625]|nr:hypothetical protein Y788_19860 [Pantoea dispersa 625]